MPSESPASDRDVGIRALISLLDDNPTEFSVEQWRTRNLRLYDELEYRKVIDASLLSREAHHFLTETLINEGNPAATDPQNAGHVRAQNENILHYALKAGVESGPLTISLAAGFIHDLNKSVGEALRIDGFAVHDDAGQVVTEQRTLAMSVGLNHLGDRTRRALEAATRLDEGALDPEVAARIDACIIHHGLGSSRFIRRLLDGDNEWWGEEFVREGVRRLVHPIQPAVTISTVIHDLADSTQQMQGGVAWLKKYPYGFWKESGLSIWQMLSGPAGPEVRTPLSLAQQIEVETATCRKLVLEGHRADLLDDEHARALEAAIVAVTRPSRMWIEDDPEYLADPKGKSVYHDLAYHRGISPAEAAHLLHETRPEPGELQETLTKSARKVDLRRTRELATLIADATHH